jgi:hypothetical protein
LLPSGEGAVKVAFRSAVVAVFVLAAVGVPSVSASADEGGSGSDCSEPRLGAVLDETTDGRSPNVVISPRRQGIPHRVSASGDQIQVVGTLDRPIFARWVVDHVTACPGWRVEVVERSSGSFAVSITEEDGMTTMVPIAQPWAIDANGVHLPTWYEADGSELTQVVDARGATVPVLFDPTYDPIDCEDHEQYFNAYEYLDMDDDDSLLCPVWGIFEARNGYQPVMAYEANVANDNGWVAVYEDGGCSFSPDTGLAFDFQVPCKAHDYCYDLRKAGFSGTVSDDACDGNFWDLMYSHCDDRILQLDCEIVADAYHLAVSAPMVVTDPDPALVEIFNLQSDGCMDVEGPSTANGAPIQQWECVGVDNQHFFPVPSDENAYAFLLKVDHSGKCIEADRTMEVLTQQVCDDSEPAQNFTFVGLFGTDTYTVRDWEDGDWQNCAKVPTSYADGIDLVHPYCNDTISWAWWGVRPWVEEE